MNIPKDMTMNLPTGIYNGLVHRYQLVKLVVTGYKCHKQMLELTIIGNQRRSLE